MNTNKFYNNLLERIILPFGDFITGGCLIKKLKKWRSISKLSEVELEKLSSKNLQRMLDFSVSKIPFYQEKQIKKEDDPYSWIKSFPIMYKKDIKDNIDALTCIPINKLIKFSSSGSSGIQGAVYMDKEARDISRAIQLLWWEWSGFYPGKPILQTGITPQRGLIKWIKDRLFRTKYTVAFGLSNDYIRRVLSKQKNKNNYHLGGYASSLYLLANYSIHNSVKDIHFDGAISWGDKLFPHYRKSIIEAFGCKVVDTYGCSEGAMIACQKDLDYYYIMSPHVYVEIVDKDGNEVNDGELGYVIITRLDNFAMPLIRYYNGDLAIKLPRNQYPNSRELNFPLLQMIIGRDTDIVRTRTDKYMIVHFFTGIFEFVEGIKQFRVIQKNLDGIEIEYIKDIQFKESDLTEIEKKITDYLQDNFEITWVEVSDIPPTPSGKPQIIQSLIV